jgi:hypothetical protein
MNQDIVDLFLNQKISYRVLVKNDQNFTNIHISVNGIFPDFAETNL